MFLALVLELLNGELHEEIASKPAPTPPGIWPINSLRNRTVQIYYLRCGTLEDLLCRWSACARTNRSGTRTPPATSITTERIRLLGGNQTAGMMRGGEHPSGAVGHNLSFNLPVSRGRAGRE